MKKFRTTFATAICACAAACVLSACGGGGSSSAATSQATAQTTTLSGIAAAGAPLRGTVYLNYSSHPMKEINAPINQDGTFSLDVAGLKPPFILKMADTSGNTFYSFASGPGIANINPLTTLAVAVGAGATDMGSLADQYANHNLTAKPGIAKAVTKASADLILSLQLLLAPYDATGADPITGAYAVNKQGLDGLFEQVAMTISGGTVTMTAKDTQATVYTAPADNIRYGGEVTAANMPTPPQHPLPGNAVLTLKLQGNLPQGTLIRNLTFSVKLPLGIAANLDSADATGLTADINTAIPIGVAAGASVYPAPSVSATNNILSINMASPAGFGTGDFLALRLIIPTVSLMTTTTTSSFSVTATNMYADVYKSTQVKGLVVVPDTLVYPTAEGKQVYDSLCSRCHTLDPSDSVVTPTLYNKTALLPDIFKTAHHSVTLTANQLDNLTAYLDAYYLGQQIPVPAIRK